MGQVVVKRDTPRQCFARLKLENGDQVMISVAGGKVKVFKMKWAGLLPGATLWTSGSVAEVVKRFFDGSKPVQRPLDAMIEALIDCRSASDIVARLCNEKISDSIDGHEVLGRYAAILQEATTKGVIRNQSELPYPKATIKDVLWHRIKLSGADPQTLDHLKIGYMALADFLPLTKEEENAVLFMQTVRCPSPDQLTDQAMQKMAWASELYVAALDKSSAEREELMRELDALM